MKRQNRRILALDVRGNSFGFVVFDGASRLLDWGVRSFRSGLHAVKIPASEKLTALIADFSPEAVVLRAPDRYDSTKKSAMRRTILSHSAKFGIPVEFFSRRAVKKVFAGVDGNKYVIAAAVASRFRELAPKLPAAHKLWMSEEYWIQVFDAAALGIAYFSQG